MQRKQACGLLEALYGITCLIRSASSARLYVGACLREWVSRRAPTHTSGTLRRTGQMRWQTRRVGRKNWSNYATAQVSRKLTDAQRRSIGDLRGQNRSTITLYLPVYVLRVNGHAASLDFVMRVDVSVEKCSFSCQFIRWKLIGAQHRSICNTCGQYCSKYCFSPHNIFHKLHFVFQDTYCRLTNPLQVINMWHV